MVHVVNCTCKDGSEDLEVCEHSLEEKGRGGGVKSLDKNTLASNCH